MKIDELIQELEEIREEHGNLTVATLGDMNPGEPVITDVEWSDSENGLVWIGNF